jgi:hypothetical protein
MVMGPPRRFPPPWTVEKTARIFCVRRHSGPRPDAYRFCRPASGFYWLEAFFLARVSKPASPERL